MTDQQLGKALEINPSDVRWGNAEIAQMELIDGMSAGGGDIGCDITIDII